ncbi:BRO family protein [Cyanobacterium aponinum UTEX 3222]|nr:BRO family protein [Cyanobacterium aponinum UTEX 3222]
MPVAIDVAKTLGYANPFDAIKRHVSENNLLHSDSRSVFGKTVTLLKEAGIYQLIFGSKLPSAIMFQQWVFEEVLPSIRKTGSYSVKSDYKTMSIDELKSELQRKKLLLEHIKLDKQLERVNKQKQADSVISDIRLAKVYRLLKKKGEITSTDVKRFIWEFKSVPNGDINELLLSLVELSKAQQIPTKKGIKIKVM